MELLEEVRQFNSALSKVNELFSVKGMSETLRGGFIARLMSKRLLEKGDPIYGVHYNSWILICLCKEIEADILKSARKKYTVAKFRDEVVAVELARLFAEEGFKPAATRDGPFHKFFDAFLELVGLEQEDTYHIIRKAVKTNQKINSIACSMGEGCIWK